MCDVVTAISLIGTGFQAYGQYQMGKYQKKTLYGQARLEEEKGKDAIRQGALEEKRIRREYARIRGTQENQLPASGLSLKGGSPADILGDTGMMAEEDVQVNRLNARRSRWGFMQSAKNLRSQGDMAMAAGKNAAIGTLINGVTTVAPKWYRPDSVGGMQLQTSSVMLPSSSFHSRSANLKWI